jgi:uncharacterized RDD family membrane protein YckC
MSVLTVTTPFHIDLEFKLAPFHKRVLAVLIDMLIICSYNYLMMRMLIQPMHVSGSVATFMYVTLLMVPSFLYPLVLEVLLNGQTIGKRVTGIKVMDRQGGEPAMGQYILRWMLGFGNYIIFLVPFIVFIPVYLIIMVGVFYLPDTITVAIAPLSQRLGDLAAGTVVIDTRARTSLHETIYLELEDEVAYKPMYPQVMRLSDRDINGIRNLLESKSRSSEHEDYIVEVSLRIRQVLGFESDLHPRDLLEQLLRDYNWLTRS